MDEAAVLLSVLSRFAVDIDDRPPIEPFGRGHINGTYLVKTDPPVVLQRISRAAFRAPDRVIENVANVTAYLKKAIARDGGDPDRETLTLIPARDDLRPCVFYEGE